MTVLYLIIQMSILRGANRTQQQSRVSSYSSEVIEEHYDRDELIKDLKQLMKENTFLRQ